MKELDSAAGLSNRTEEAESWINDIEDRHMTVNKKEEVIERFIF